MGVRLLEPVGETRERRQPARRAAVLDDFSDAPARRAPDGRGRQRGEGGGTLGLSGDRVLALKDEAATLLYETPGLRLPSQLLLYAKTLSYVFGLGREISPETDVMKLAVPYLLRFLAEGEG